MYSIFTYIWVIFTANVGKYSIHGAYGIVSHYRWTRLGYQIPQLQSLLISHHRSSTRVFCSIGEGVPGLATAPNEAEGKSTLPNYKPL
jgi:hypothetical protein